MPILQLTDEIAFPPVHSASKSGMIAVGGDLSPQRLLVAYRHGIFPWYSEGEPILWWSPDPRFVLLPEKLKVSRSMRQLLKKNTVHITYDQNFRAVIEACRRPRIKQNGTWINPEMKEAYCALHDMGFAHSVEAWYQGELVGGLYGLSLGRCFFGESMFSILSNASKVAFIHLVSRLKDLQFEMIDCQIYTDHLKSLGANYISRIEFIHRIEGALKHETLKGKWETLGSFKSDSSGTYAIIN